MLLYNDVIREERPRIQNLCTITSLSSSLLW